MLAPLISNLGNFVGIQKMTGAVMKNAQLAYRSFSSESERRQLFNDYKKLYTKYLVLLFEADNRRPAEFMSLLCSLLILYLSQHHTQLVTGYRCDAFLLLLSHRMLFPEAQRLRMTEEVLRRADVDPTLRPADITISQFRALADAYAGLCGKNHALFSYDYREELRRKRLSRRQTKGEGRDAAQPGAALCSQGGGHQFTA